MTYKEVIKKMTGLINSDELVDYAYTLSRNIDDITEVNLVNTGREFRKDLDYILKSMTYNELTDKFIATEALKLNNLPYDIQMVLQDRTEDNLEQCLTNATQLATRIQMGLAEDTHMLYHYLLNQVTKGMYTEVLIAGINLYRRKGIMFSYLPISPNITVNDVAQGTICDGQSSQISGQDDVCVTENDIIVKLNIVKKNNRMYLIIEEIYNCLPITQTTYIEDVLLSMLDSFYILDPGVFLESLVSRMCNLDYTMMYSKTRKSNIRIVMANNAFNKNQDLYQKLQKEYPAVKVMTKAREASLKYCKNTSEATRDDCSFYYKGCPIATILDQENMLLVDMNRRQMNLTLDELLEN